MVRTISGLCIALLFLTGCYETGELLTREQAGEVYFSVSKAYLQAKDADGYILSDLSVAKDDCNKNCVVWSIVRKTSISNMPEMTDLPVRYGAVPAGMKETVPPAPLSNGKYTVSATVGLLQQGKVVGGGLLTDRFELSQEKANPL